MSDETRPAEEITADLALLRDGMAFDVDVSRLLRDVEPLLRECAELREERDRLQKKHSERITTHVRLLEAAEREAETNGAALVRVAEERDDLRRQLADARAQLAEANSRARALSEKIDRCTAHIRNGMQLANDEPDAGLEALVVGWTKYHGDQCRFKARAEQAEATIREIDDIADPYSHLSTVGKLGRIRQITRAALAAAGPSAPEPESMRWNGGPDDLIDVARAIVAWVNANGGEARFKPDPTTCEGEGCVVDHGGDVIEIAGPGGVNVYVEPGDTVQMTDEWFHSNEVPDAGPGRWRDPKLRAFRVVSEPSAPETPSEAFERALVEAAPLIAEQVKASSDEPARCPEMLHCHQESGHEGPHAAVAVNDSLHEWRTASGFSPDAMDWAPAGRDLVEDGRRLASEREDLIAEGADPSDLIVPLAPPIDEPARCEHGETEICPGPAASGTPDGSDV